MDHVPHARRSNGRAALPQIGYVALFGFVVLIFCLLPVQGFFASRFGRIRKATVAIRDKRIRILSDVLLGMQVLKLYAWEIPFQKTVMAFRNQETSSLRRATYYKSVNDGLFVSSSALMALCTFLPYVALGNPLTATVVFPTISFYSIVRLSVANSIPRAIEAMAEARYGPRSNFKIRDRARWH